MMKNNATVASIAIVVVPCCLRACLTLTLLDLSLSPLPPFYSKQQIDHPSISLLYEFYHLV